MVHFEKGHISGIKRGCGEKDPEGKKNSAESVYRLNRGKSLLNWGTKRTSQLLANPTRRWGGRHRSAER